MTIRTIIQGFFLLALSFYSFESYGQIVSIDPVVFSLDQEITVTYDATKGSGGLVDVNQVFAHTGIITASGGAGNWMNVQGNWGQFDPKVQMTNIGNNLHQIIYTPNDFYDLNGSEDVVQLAFVFRNEDGSKEGKTNSLSDIFVDVPDPNIFSANFISPDEEQLVLELNDNLEIKIAATQSSLITLFDNGIQLEEVQGTELTYNLNATSSGNHIVVFEADNGMEVVSKSFSYVVLEGELDRENPPIEITEGLTRIDESSVYLSLYAPRKEHVFVLGDFNDFKVNIDYQMNLSEDGATWWIELENLDPDEWHAYQYLIDGSFKIADPYSELIIDDRNDEDIAEELNSVPMAYPKDLTSGHATIFQTIAEIYEWQIEAFDRPDVEDLVIYELMMRDFLEDHSYASLLDTLEYLNRLGVNVIELMPVSEFENNQSWGYNVSYHMALDKYYGSPEAFKQFVDAAHSLGMAVVLDIVYNHAFGQSPLVRLYWDQQNSRPAADSPYFNPEARHPYNVGFDFNHESPLTQRYVKQTIAYWMDEYRIDGFRFDLSKGFTQNQSSGDFAFSAYDQGRINRLSNYGNFIWDKDPNQILILEHFAEASEDRELASLGFLLWGNANYNFNEATMGYTDGNKSDFSHIYHENRGFSDPHLIGYMESHDEERLMYKNVNFGNSSGSYSAKELSTALDRTGMAAAFFFSIPGPKMIWQFGELGYDNSINRCEDGTVSENCRLSPKPIRWDFQDESDRRDLYEVHAKMIELKKEYPAMKSENPSLNLQSTMKRIALEKDGDHLVALGNFGVDRASILPEFPHDGIWFDYLGNRRYEITNTTDPITLNPGEFIILIDNKDFVTSTSESIKLNEEFHLFPNPVSDLLYFDSNGLNNATYIMLHDLSGNKFVEINLDFEKGADVSQLNPGMYIISVFSAEHEKIAVSKLIKI